MSKSRGLKMFDKIHSAAEDSVTRSLFFDNFKRKRPLEPERELMLAVLADAVECYCKYSGARDGIGMRLFQEAQEWLFNDDERRPFSFVNVCAALQLEPGYIRRGISARKWHSITEAGTAEKQSRTLPLMHVRRKLTSGRKHGIRAPARRTRPSSA